MRPLLTTSIVERDQLAAAPEMERAFQQEMAERGVLAQHQAKAANDKP